MIRELKTKPDFGRIIERFEAWWHGELVDRPPVSLWIKPSRPFHGPVSRHHTQRERWLDAEFAVNSAIAGMEQNDYLGDSFPVFWPNIGPEITATLFGCELDFSETTSWSHPVINEAEEWNRILKMQPDFNNPYWQAVEQMTDLAIELCDNRFIVGMTDLHGSYDILAALRDPQRLCMDLLDCPELVRRAGEHVAQGYVESFNRSYKKVSAAGFGSTTWCSTYHSGPAYVPSCDFWCMVSPEIARKMIFPTLQLEIEPLERSIFHLDGPDALRHLDLMLELPQLDAVQWVYGAGHGCAAEWMPIYRRIRQAGKSLQLIAHDAADALAVLKQLGPKGLWITIQTPFPSAAEANAFLKQVSQIK